MHCPICPPESSEMVLGDVEHSLKLGEHTFTGMLRGYLCPGCKVQNYIPGPEAHRFELAIAAHLAYVGKPTGEMVAFIRKSLGHPAGELAKLLDLSPEHLSRMEHGKRDIDRRIWALLGALAIDAHKGNTATLIRLQKLALGQPAPETVKVDL